MSKTNAAQLPLLEVPAPPVRRETRSRRRLSAELTVKHCNALLAELDRVAEAQQARAQHVADLFDAAERAAHSQSRKISL